MNNEKEYLQACKQLARLREKRLRSLRTQPFSLVDFLAEECVVDECDRRIALLEKTLRCYDRLRGGRRGDWIPLYSGRRFWPLDPRPEDVDSEDVAHALAHLCRFGGHVKQFYSVAQHACLTAALCPKSTRRFGLMHDAAEMITGDVITPIKRLFKRFYEPAEEKIMQAVAQRFGFAAQFNDPGCRSVVKRCDLVVLATEVRDCSGPGLVNGALTELPEKRRITRRWGPKEAKKVFLACLNDPAALAEVWERSCKKKTV